jgi:hypothetical protein
VRVESPFSDQPQQHWGGGGVHQPSGDGDVLDPQVLEVERRGFAVDADVRDVAAGPHELGTELERSRHTGQRAPVGPMTNDNAV